jgi:YjbE family integral membrane protein
VIALPRQGLRARNAYFFGVGPPRRWSPDVDWMSQLPSAAALWIFGQVVLINFVLSGDNAIVVGMAAAGLPSAERKRALWLGIALATVLRVLFSAVATRLLQILGLLLAGGILLLWVAWKMARELRQDRAGTEREAQALFAGAGPSHGRARKTMREAVWQIMLADVSMSLDNALAVAGAAMDYPAILALGLATSVLLMGLAATLVARLLERYRWLVYVGLAIVVYVALRMMWEGGQEVALHLI